MFIARSYMLLASQAVFEFILVWLLLFFCFFLQLWNTFLGINTVLTSRCKLAYITDCASCLSLTDAWPILRAQTVMLLDNFTKKKKENNSLWGLYTEIAISTSFCTNTLDRPERQTPLIHHIFCHKYDSQIQSKSLTATVSKSDS